MLAQSHRQWLVVSSVGFALTLSLLLMLFLASAASAVDSPLSPVTVGMRYVATGGVDGGNDCALSASPCATIQRAIDLALAGEEVRVAAGTYDQVQVKSNYLGYTFTQVAFINKGLTLQGGFTPADWNTADPVNNVTVLDAQGHGRGVTIIDTGNALVTVDGFTITNGDYTDLGNPDGIANQSCNRAGEDCGGGLFGKYSAIALKNLLVTNNIAGRDGGDGGGIYLISPQEVTIENTRFISNSAETGGGMFVLWQDYPYSIRDSLFQENSADYFGGLALNDFRTEVIIERTDFYSNVASLGEGGGLYLHPAVENASLEMDRLRLIGNQAKGSGKAIYLDPNMTNGRMAAKMSNLLLSGNGNTPGAPVTADDAVIFVTAYRKALDLELAQVTAADNPVTNFLSVISRNNAGESTTVVISNILLTGFDYAFAAQEINDGTVIIEHANSLLYDITIDTHHDLGGTPTFTGTGTVTGDPLLDGSYHLTASSAAIDAGLEAGVAHDIDGQYRPQGAAPDIGADEFYQLLAPSSVTISGPGGAVAQSPTAFVATVAPLASTQPITYVWQATGLSPITQTGGISNTVLLNWPTVGNKVIQVSASNSQGTVNDSFAVDVTGEPLLAIRKDAPAETLVGSNITYTLTISNEGVVEATGLVITDTIPANATNVTPLDGGIIVAGDTLQWNLASLAAGAKSILRFQVTAEQSIVNDDYAVSAAGGFSAVGAEAVTTIFGEPDLSISKSGPSSAGVGESIEYQITVINDGAIAAHELVISDTLPAGATYLSGGTLVGNVVRWQLSSLPANGGKETVSFSVSATKTITNDDYKVVDRDGFTDLGASPVVTIVSAGTRYVAPGGTNGLNTCTESGSPCATIQHAVDIANDGEEVRVAAGTYDQVQVKTSSQGYTFTQVAYIDKGLTLRGGFSTADWNTADPVNNVTVLDAQGHGRGVTIFESWDDLVTVDGFTLTNGDYTDLGNPDGIDNQSCNHAGEDCGGGLFGKFSAITLKNLLVTNNIAGRDGGDGGGIYLISAQAVNIENTRVISNSSSDGAGGGMFVLWQNYPLSIQDSLFQDNSADNFGGLALNDFRTTVSIERTAFVNNVASLGEAGGLYARLAVQNARLEMDRVTLTGNQAKGNGKAIYLSSNGTTTEMSARLTNLLLAENSNTPGAPAAPAEALIFADVRNRSLDLEIAQVTATDNPLANFLTVHSDNSAGQATTVQITNTLLSGFDYAFAAQEVSDGQVILEHSHSLLDEIGVDEYHNLGGSPSFSSSGTVTGDPLLNSSYHLSIGSAAIDAGVDTGISHDIDGDERPFSDFPDIGADELVMRNLYLPMILR